MHGSAVAPSRHAFTRGKARVHAHHPHPTPPPAGRRASKIKSRAYRKVHKKPSADAELAALGALDSEAAEKLQRKRETERVTERMTLKHKNTSRWAKHALKHQSKNTAVRSTPRPTPSGHTLPSLPPSGRPRQRFV